MHDCPECYEACDCDGEDTWNDAASMECEHQCEPSDDHDFDDDYDDDDAEPPMT